MPLKWFNHEKCFEYFKNAIETPRTEDDSDAGLQKYGIAINDEQLPLGNSYGLPDLDGDEASNSPKMKNTVGRPALLIDCLVNARPRSALHISHTHIVSAECREVQKPESY